MFEIEAIDDGQRSSRRPLGLGCSDTCPPHPQQPDCLLYNLYLPLSSLSHCVYLYFILFFLIASARLKKIAQISQSFQNAITNTQRNVCG